MDRLIEITVTQRCNKSCSYCFERGCGRAGDAFDEWIPMVEKACADAGPDGAQIAFWGGEPFLRHDRMLKLIDATRAH